MLALLWLNVSLPFLWTRGARLKAKDLTLAARRQADVPLEQGMTLVSVKHVAVCLSRVFKYIMCALRECQEVNQFGRNQAA